MALDKVRVEPLSMNQIQKLGGESLFVLNRSRVVEGAGAPHGGDINFVIKVGDDSINVVIPNTWIPWDIGSSVSVKDLINNTTFRRYITRGILVAISLEDASKILSDSSAKVELGIVNERLNGTHRNTNFAAGAEQHIEVTLGENYMRELNTSGDQTDLDEGVGILAVEIVQSPDLSDEQRYAMVLNAASRFTEKEWDYVIKNISDDRIKSLSKKYKK